MPADASIYGLIRPQAPQPGPLENYGAMMQLRAMGDASQLHALQRTKLEQDMAEESAFKSKLSDWVNAGGKGDLPPEAFAASPTRAIAIQKSQREGLKTEAEILTKDRENFIALAADAKQRLPLIRDQASLAAFRDEQMQRAGMFSTPAIRQAAMRAAQAIPATFDANVTTWIQNQVVKAEELFTPKPETKDIGGKMVTVDMNPFTNPGILKMELTKTITPDAALSAATTRRGQDQPVWDESRGAFITRPGVGGGGGAPAAASPTGGAAPAVPSAVPQVIKPVGLPAKPGDVHTLRNEFNNLPEVKEFKATLPVVEAARKAPDTLAGDIQLAYAVGKILDPNSVVREGELKLVGDAATMMNKYEGEIRGATQGVGRLRPETRTALVAMLDNAVNQRETAYRQAEATYKGVAEKNGIPVDQVIITPMARTKAEPAASAAAPKTFNAMPDPSQYSGRRIKAPDGTVYQSDGKNWKRQG